MPLFEYVCKHCGQKFEELIMGSDPEAPKCPSCGSDEVERCISAPSLRSSSTAFSGTMPSASSCGSSSFS